MRKLIDNLQAFKPDQQSESALDLTKDMLMYLIQKQKHKKFQPDDWFQLINSLHEFLTKYGGDGEYKTPDLLRRDTEEFVSQLESEIRSLKFSNE